MELVSETKHVRLLRALPSVDQVLHGRSASTWLSCLPRSRVTELIRVAVAEVRADLLAGRELREETPTRAVEALVERKLDGLQRSTLRPVINASGVILHTNLGRAPLSASAVEAIRATAGRYNNLEYDVKHGRRGSRDAHSGDLLTSLLGVRALVVNNNAAAIFLVLHELARKGEVVISRGELVEIGDGFRIPDILAASQASIVEIGATNRTHLDDYRRAIGPDTKALLRIHPSNFRQVGFTGRPSLAELVGLARSVSIPLVEDLGSGCIVDLRDLGIEDEPPVRASLRAGVDIVTFSGDKLLGGPQAGIIAGVPEWIARIRRNPLFRALRVDKLTLAALTATLRDYLFDRDNTIPVLRLMRISETSLAARAQRFVERLGLESAQVVAGESLLGGGSTPMQSLPTQLVAISAHEGTTIQQIERKLRSNDPSVIARIEKDTLLLDLRTVFETEEEALIVAVRRATSLESGE